MEQRLASYPLLVFAGECRALKDKLAEVCAGQGFVLQGGDRAEAFADFAADKIRDSLRVLLQMAVVLTFGAGLPVVKLGRMAGQFAKPCSSDMEEIGGCCPAELSRRHRQCDRVRACRARARPAPAARGLPQSAATLNLLRAFTQGGYASLTRVHQWTMGFLDRSLQGERYRDMAGRITEALDFMRACGVTDLSTPEITRTTLFTSHEALLLGYEQALTGR